MSPRLSVLASVLALVASLALPSPAAAQERKGGWEISPFFGTNLFASELEIDDASDYGLRVGYNFHENFEIEFQFLRTGDGDLQDGDSTLIDGPTVFFNNPGTSFSLDAYTLRFLINPTNERRRFKPYVAVGAGIHRFDSDPALSPADEGAVDAEVFTVGGGIRHRLSAHLAFRAEVEVQYSFTDSYNNQNLNLGLSWSFGAGSARDQDGDGVLDLSDRCPDTPEGALVDKHDGCPWDLDQDGVMEGIDKCADTPRGWPVDEDGCPLDSDSDAVPDGADGCADTPSGAIVDRDGCPLDSDGDTILDGIDRCPDTPAGAVVDPSDSPTAGCPHDSDDDGVPDGIDQCMPTPPDAWVDEQGCPRDSDGDRILDGIDQCPGTPAGQKIDREGCPRVRLDKDEPQILKNVRFWRGAELYPGADAWIALLLEALEYWPDLTIELGVYTDSSGTPEGNRTIARRRGEVLKEWLVQHGVAPRRLEIKAYGAVDFIADNETEEGREANRRVEVKRLSGDLRKHPKPRPEPAAEEEGAPAEPEGGAEEPAPESTPEEAPGGGPPEKPGA